MSESVYECISVRHVFDRQSVCVRAGVVCVCPAVIVFSVCGYIHMYLMRHDDMTGTGDMHGDMVT